MEWLLIKFIAFEGKIMKRLIVILLFFPFCSHLQKEKNVKYLQKLLDILIQSNPGIMKPQRADIHVCHTFLENSLLYTTLKINREKKINEEIFFYLIELLLF